jgi:hypothetical protein
VRDWRDGNRDLLRSAINVGHAATVGHAAKRQCGPGFPLAEWNYA